MDMNSAMYLTSVALPLLLFALAGLRRVPEQNVLTVHRFGRYRRTLAPGLHWVVPGLDRIACNVPLIGHHLSLPTRSLGARSARADLYFQILEPLRAGAELERIDELVAQQASLALDEFAAEPDASTSGWAAAAETLKIELNRRCAGRGLRVIRCAFFPSA